MLPIESILAVFPSTVEVGKITLRPLTLYHATALETLGVSIGSRIHAGNVYLAAWILTKDAIEIRDIMSRPNKNIDAEFNAWSQKAIRESIDELIKGVTSIIEMALSAHVAGESKGTQYAGERGFGWTLETGEAITHEYSMSFDDAMSMPMTRAFALLNCARQRNGGKNGGPDYYERILIPKIKDIIKAVYG